MRLLNFIFITKLIAQSNIFTNIFQTQKFFNYGKNDKNRTNFKSIFDLFQFNHRQLQ